MKKDKTLILNSSDTPASVFELGYDEGFAEGYKLALKELQSSFIKMERKIYFEEND